MSVADLDSSLGHQIDAHCWRVISDTSPNLAKAINDLLRRGDNPREVAAFVRRAAAGSGSRNPNFYECAVFGAVAARNGGAS